MGFKRQCCGLLFWTKAFIAFTGSIAIYAYLVYMVIQMYKPPLRQTSFGNYNPTVLVDPSSLNCHADRNSLAKLEPPDGKVLYGFHIRWENGKRPEDYIRILRRNPPIFNAFMQLDPKSNDPFRQNDLNQHAKDCETNHAILQITLMPVVRITEIPDGLYETFAQFLKLLNEKYGVAIFLRFGHEMNGFWTDYGYRPKAFIDGFRKLTAAVRKESNMTAMVWAPNVGVAYPYNIEGIPASPVPLATGPEAEEFRLLDTNNDGELTLADDPYLPYYPGDEYVDWVGVSVYHYPGTVNTLPTNGQAIQYITGQGFSFTDGSRNFYQRFAVERGKPMMLPESGAPFITGAAPGPGELNIKQTWWRQLLDPGFHRQYPKIKAILNFEDAKVETGSFRTWAILDDAAIYNPFLADLPTFESTTIWNLKNATCDGKLNY